MLDFLRKFLPKTDRPAPSAAGARGGFNYSGGPLFGPWDPSVHAAPGQYARFGRAAARSPFFQRVENVQRFWIATQRPGL